MLTRHLRHRRAPQSSRAGLTMVEIMVSLVVLLVAVGGLLGSLSSFVFLGDAARERTLAVLAAEDALERMRATEFGELFARFNGSAADDPAAGFSPGSSFDVPGLNARSTDADGLTGQILFPVNPATPTELHENFVDATFGCPRDLNGDGAIDAANHAGDVAVLPVRIRVEWRGNSGDRSLEISSLLRNSR